MLNYRDRDQLLKAAREKALLLADNTRISLFPDYTVAVYHRCSMFTDVKKHVRTAGLTYALIFPAKLKIIYDQCSHFFDTPQARARMDHTLPETGPLWDTHPGARQHPYRRRGGGPTESLMRATPSLHQAMASQQKALISAAALISQPRCPSNSSPEGSTLDSDTDGSVTLFPSITPQTANDL
ncbi:hypothetical protein NDU88_001991 [Pleurodeles waltl]|uniref:Uncharacterized protein n=1 Tax=Pleurodeles waltl TaxID=8319 RepID=A0AAV7S9L4_PLEWA|nr:hypothetical protein NDU88_001991 [Pleurodeles waltl]